MRLCCAYPSCRRSTPISDIDTFTETSDPDAVRRAKAAVRQAVLARRDAMPPAARAAASARIRQRAAAFLDAHAGAVSAFWPIRSEADLTPLLAELTAAGRPVLLPAILDRQTICFRHFQSVTTLVPAPFGTREPPADAETGDPDILLVPVAAFDRHGGRLGYGAGHYDRALARLEKRRSVLAVGIAFACQEVEAVPQEPHDRRLDRVITETETVIPEGSD